MVIVTGLSGAGRSTAAKCLEDLGFFVVDNLPPELIATLVDLGSRSQGAVTRLAVVMDVRSRAFSSDLRSVIRDLADRRMRPRVLFLEARDDVLVRRFENVRREHPLQGDGRLIDGIAAERELLCRAARRGRPRHRHQQPVRARAARRHRVGVPSGERRAARPTLRATVLSFGYKYGLPVDADLVVDVRFLPNPHWIPELRELTGRDAEVRDYVLSQEGADEFLDRYAEMLRDHRRRLPARGQALPDPGRRLHRRQAPLRGDGRASWPSGCAAMGVEATVVHRDLGRE